MIHKILNLLVSSFFGKAEADRFILYEKRDFLFENLLSSLGHLEPSKFKVTYSERYFQKLIEFQGWTWQLTYNSYQELYYVEIFDEDGKSFYSLDSKEPSAQNPVNALLYGYTKILAMRRNIVPGQWHHYQGRIIEVDENFNYYFDGQTLKVDPKDFLSLVWLEDETHQGLLKFRKIDSQQERFSKTANIFARMEGTE